MAAASRVRKRLYRILRGGATILFLLFVLEVFVLPALATAHPSQLRKIHLPQLVGGLVGGIALEAAALVAYAYVTRSVLPKEAPPLERLLRIDLSTMAVSHVLPGGGAPGTALGYRLLTASGVSPADASFCVATQGIGSALVLNALFWVALIASVPFHSVHNPFYFTAAFVGAVFLAIIAGIVFLLTKGEDHVRRLLHWLARKLPFLTAERVERVTDEFIGRVNDLREDPRLLRRALVWACANWLLDAGSLWVFLLAFGHLTSPIDLMVAYGLANVLAVIPITPAGLGIIEGVLIPTLVRFGTPSTVAVLGVVAYRLVNFWLPIPVGAGAYVSLRLAPGAPWTKAQEANAQEAEVQVAEVQEANAQDAEVHVAEVQVAEVQEANAQDAEVHVAEVQVAEVQEAGAQAEEPNQDEPAHT